MIAGLVTDATALPKSLKPAEREAGTETGPTGAGCRELCEGVLKASGEGDRKEELFSGLGASRCYRQIMISKSM